MIYKLSLTEFLVTIVLLIALAHGAASLYQRWLVSLNESTAERIMRR